MKRVFLAAGVLALAVALTVLGGDDAPTEAVADPASGACLVGTPDCNDTPGIDVGEPNGQPPSSGMCAPDMPDCVDVVTDDPAERCLPEAEGCDDTPGQEEEPAGDVYDRDAARAEAQSLLGRTEAELEADVRIGRRGEETMMLTEDYVLGRMTVELDINDMDEWIVTAVTVELPDGPETFTRYLP